MVMTKPKQSIWGKVFGALAIAALMFLTGFMANTYLHDVKAYADTGVSGAVSADIVPEAKMSETNCVQEIAEKDSIFSVLDRSTKERSSPADHITEDQIHVYNDRVSIDIQDATWGTFMDTNSMDPVLDAGHNSLELKPKDFKDVKLGDIIVYKSEEYGYIIHRVIATGFDTEGWYCTAKGDNNYSEDPWKIRFGQIEGIVVAIIY